MNEQYEDNILVVVRYKNSFRWFRSPRELWVLDLDKWRNEFIDHGHFVPDFEADYRFGIRIVCAKNVEVFLSNMSKYETSTKYLEDRLQKEYEAASSWWDVAELFPSLFVDFDLRCLCAFYSEGTPLERYVPDGWKSQFKDFTTDEKVLPDREKYWLQGDKNILKELIARES